MKYFIIALCLCLAACNYGPEKRASWITSKISDELDLNDEQKAKLEAVKRSYFG
jgi:hypothetical protein